MLKILCTYFLLVLLIITATAQNPFVQDATISPAPLNPNGFGTLSFNFGLSEATGFDLPQNGEIEITVDFTLIEPSAVDPVDAISGNGKQYFDWVYDENTTSYTGTQNQDIPGLSNFELNFAFAVTGTSASPGNNGAQINLQPGIAGNSNTSDDETSEFTFTDQSAPLPVELTGFKGTASDCAVALQWSTASELNNSHFEVQHSTSGKAFQILTKVAGAGTTLEAQSYDFLHENAATSNYYRLKQVDHDGSFEYSNVISVTTACKSDLRVELFPTLTRSNSVTIALHAEIEGSLTLELVDANGQLIRQQQLQGGTSDFNEQLNVTDLATGQYYVRIIAPDGRYVTKSFVKAN